MKWRHGILILLVMAAAPFLWVAGRLLTNYVTRNVHVVIPGKIDRTAQLNQAELAHYAQQFHWKTLINLRGEWPDNPWYQGEKAFAQRHHLYYASLHFSAYHLPSKPLLRELVLALENGPKPLAFHCEGGADRTGMASAISVILFDPNATLSQIKREASWHYNAISRKTVGYQVMRNYFAWLKAHHEVSSKQHFLEWLNSPQEMKPYYGWFLV